MKDDQTKSENKFSILGSIKGILRIATGLTLGTVTLAAGLTRGIVGSVGHAALTVAGAVATVAAFANHTLNFLGHRALKLIILQQNMVTKPSQIFLTSFLVKKINIQRLIKPSSMQRN